MDVSSLLASLMGLAVLLALLVILLYIPSQTQKNGKAQKATIETPKAPQILSLEEIRDICKDKESSLEVLRDALDILLKYKGIMPEKLGLRPHPDAVIYLDIIFKAARHPNINKDIIVKLIRELEKNNPKYKKELNDALMRGLNSRGL